MVELSPLRQLRMGQLPKMVSWYDPRLLARIKRIARSRYLNYQSMIKQWLSERLEKEL